MTKAEKIKEMAEETMLSMIRLERKPRIRNQALRMIVLFKEKAVKVLETRSVSK